MIYQLAVALSLASFASASLYTEDPTHLKYLWESFKREYSREYATMDEENNRFRIFVDNMRSADARNNAERGSKGNAVHGITKFSDLSQAEFESRYLTADPSEKSTEGRTMDTTARTVNAAAGLVDWSAQGATTPVKDQGYCGSCWAFSATEQIESDYYLQKGKLYTLSAQQVTSCTGKPSAGCDGGWTESAYSYVKSAGGIESEADYPYNSYQGVTHQCEDQKTKYVLSITGFTTVKGESNMASYVQSTGPLSVCVDATTWNSYNGGIMKTCGTRVNHCVQAVGVDASAGGYWKVRNSWGKTWGEAGYIRLAYGQDTCAITNDPTYVQAK